jgi:hypothetical protein
MLLMRAFCEARGGQGETRELVGGECPYWGCILSKTLLRSTGCLAQPSKNLPRNQDAARSELIGSGVNVSEVFHFDSMLLRATEVKGRVPGPDPEGRSYFSFASFNDPDGNGWLLQQVTGRLPGRGLSLDVSTLTALLQEAEKGHGEYEPTAPNHHWSQWYAAYIAARALGSTPDEAATHGAVHVEHARGPCARIGSSAILPSVRDRRFAEQLSDDCARP